MERKLNAVLIDDETPALNVLNYLIKLHCPDIHVERTFTDSVEAFGYIQSSEPDVAFVDIRMPKKDGIQLLNSLKSVKTRFIFTTAHEEYAMKAWKTAAISYLLKPVDPEDLIHAVEKAKHLSIQSSSADLEVNIGTEVFKSKNIVSLEARGSYCDIKLANKSTAVVSKNLKVISPKLPEDSFIRIHRGTIINVIHLVNFDQISRKIVLSNGSEYTVSGRKLATFAQFLRKNKIQW